ncbi:uncharacterized protein CcaverHIS019_0302330 [Cutaneotrichosporon cavernicola]|uniref:Uncharacterized protein n=1 Tax=Cutaneotrichosporon cavernicola TaxID=279322 RepID=A0AA48IGK2_9TREE|nr:uncharacterized protein CcaverHIS019_0302330 [Cutaneotrichosporon cavernicola]BEI90163.1 hypothetical protein CcaverHIS019_0302330 [Cutaneotrichosporon cavernicola]
MVHAPASHILARLGVRVVLTLNLSTPIGNFSLIFVNLGPQNEWRASFGIYGACYHRMLKVPSLGAVLTKGLFFVPLTTILVFITSLFLSAALTTRQKQ